MNISRIVIFSVLLCYCFTGQSQSDTVPPTQPVNLISSDTTTSSVHLSWDDSYDANGIDGYIVFKGPDSLTSVPITECIVTGLTASTAYSFSVIAFDTAGNRSIPSSVVNVRTLDPPDTEKPTIPTGLASHDITSNSVRITWNESTDNIGVTGYIIYNGTDSTTTVAVLECVVSELEVSTDYSFSVVAFDAAGNRSDASAPLNIKTLDPPDTENPTSPSGLASHDTTTTSVRLTWILSTDNVGVIGYIVYRGIDSLTTVATTQYIVTSLVPSSDYSFSIVAIDAAGNKSAQSNTVNVRTLDPPDTENPTAPGNLTPHDITMSSIRLTWSAATDNIDVVAYVVYQGTDSLTQVTGLQYIASGLSPSTNYLFSVIAKDAAGNKSAPSNIVDTVTARDMIAPSIPAGLSATTITKTGFHLSWNPSTDNIGVTGYVVYSGTDSLTTAIGTQYDFTGLKSDSLYSITIRSKDAAGNKSNPSALLLVKTLAEPDTTKPSSPTALTANNITVTSVRLTWNASTDNIGVIGYVVYRGIDSLTTVTALEHTIIGLIPSTSYVFSVRAKDAAGNKSAASTVNVTTANDISVPTAPANLTATDIAISSVRLSWSASTDNVGVIGYIVYRGTDSLTTVTALTYTVNGLTINTNYTFSVRAKDAAGNKSSASTITVKTSNDITVPTTPANLAGSNISTTGLRLTWNPSSDNVGVTGYIVYRGTDSLTTVSGTEYLVTGLTPSTNYSFRVKARDAAGNRSGFSNQVNIKTLGLPDIEPPTTPTYLIATNITSISVRLAWNVSSDDVGVTGYIVYNGSDSIAFINALEYIVTGLTPSTKYSFTLKARDAAGNKSPFSNIVNIKTHILPDTDPPSAPANLTATNVSWFGAHLSWDASTDNIKVTSYRIYINDVLFGTSLLTEYNISGLDANTSYSIYVRANDAAANLSLKSNTIALTTIEIPDTINPTKPGTLTYDNLTATSVSLSWGAASDNIGVIGYRIYRNGGLVANTTSLNHEIENLKPATTYAFSVRAYDEAGNYSNISNIVQFTTLQLLDSINPTAPGNLTYDSLTSSSVRLLWEASSDNVEVVGYRVYLNGGLLANTNDLEYKVINLKSLTDYSFIIKAYDASGNISDASIIIEITTLINPDSISPTVPANLRYSDLTSFKVNLSWDSSIDSYGVSGYRIYMNDIFISTTGLTQFTLNHLTPKSNYCIYIRAFDAAGNLSDTSNHIVFTTPGIQDDTPPSTPDGLVVFVLTNTMIGFRWNPSTDNDELFGYQIYVNNELITTTEMTEFTLIDLFENTSYIFYVRAMDISGNVSPPSIKITASTDGTITGFYDESNISVTSLNFAIGNKRQILKIPIEKEKIEYAEIYNIEGAKIYSSNELKENQEISIDNSHIDRGVYILVITGNSKRFVTKLLY